MILWFAGAYAEAGDVKRASDYLRSAEAKSEAVGAPGGQDLVHASPGPQRHRGSENNAVRSLHACASRSGADERSVDPEVDGDLLRERGPPRADRCGGTTAWLLLGSD